MELNEWNPMEEDYYSLAFNSYDKTQGLRITIDLYPSWKNNKKTNKGAIHTVSLYITGIPLNIDEKGLKLIFSNYGKVLHSYRGFPKDSSINTCFGFIDYETIKEAELAMRELDGKPPYNLQVIFAKSGKEKEDQLIMKERELFSFLEKSLHLNEKKFSSKIDQEKCSVIKLKDDTKILSGVSEVNSFDVRSINEVMKDEIINEKEENFNYKLINDANEITNIDLEKVTKIYYYEDCDFVQLSTGEVNVIITSVVTPEAIFCHIADSNNSTALANLNNDISSYCMNSSFNNYYPVCGEICLARYSDDGLWYRAVPLKIIRGKLQVIFLDFGNVEILDFEDTRQMIPRFMELPIQAVHCMLSGIASQNWNAEVIEELLKILPQKEELKVKVLEKIQKNNDVIYILDIPFITAHLIKTGLVK